jgi:hypothetical protein
VLTYQLERKYRRFEALVGMNALTSRRGAAVVRLLLDGRAVDLPGMNPISSERPPVAIRVDVSEIQELALVTDFSDIGPVQADVNWADARLVP